MNTDGLIAILMAPFIGSFLGVIVDRLPEGRTVLADRSACDICGQTLGPLELLPIAAYLWQRGRCRNCKGTLRSFYPLIELAAMAVATSAALVLSGWLLWVSLYLGWGLLTLGAIDARHKILPDPINLPLIPVGLGVTWLHSPDQLGTHVVGAILGFLILAAIAWTYRRFRKRDGLGLGDAKLLSAGGAWLGWAPLPGLLVVAALSALIIVLARAVFGDRLGSTDEIAFGPFLALAFWASWLLGPIILFQGIGT
ncbi:MAG: prepilin peptidase [Geminicoccaceae bacterium]